MSYSNFLVLCKFFLFLKISLFLSNSELVKQRITTAITGGTLANFGVGANNFVAATPSFFFSNFQAGDKGCYPTFGHTGRLQTLTNTGIINSVAIAGATFGTNIGQDLNNLASQLCVISGTCCTTDLCNTSNIKKINIILLIISIITSKFVF